MSGREYLAWLSCLLIPELARGTRLLVMVVMVVMGSE
jgi:hypothetical protein